MQCCCANCFRHAPVKQYIQENGQPGDCSFCRSRAVPVVDAEDGYFARLMAPFAYFFKPGERGFPLDRFLTKQIDLLSDSLTPAAARSLLFYLFQGTYSTEQLNGMFTATLSIEHSSRIEQWEAHKQNLKHGNRFGFGVDTQLVEHMKRILRANEELVPAGTRLFRARLGKPSGARLSAYEGSDIMSAPADRVTEGRINPRGIPYLYVATDPDTAIAEIRPYKSAEVSVGTIQVTRDIKVSSFNNAVYHGDSLVEQLEAYCLTNRINMELSRPVAEDSKYLSYLPTQYVAELAKHLGFEGIAYQSALADGTNYCFFDESKVTFEASRLYVVHHVRFESAPRSDWNL